MTSIEVKELSKKFGETIAVNNVSFEVENGQIFGLIGPDGAGKTTIIRTIVSLLEIEQGVVFFQGKDIKKHPKFVRQQIGYMPQRFSLYQDLTVRENLDFFGDLFKVPKREQNQRREELYDFSKLGAFEKRKAGALSGGMKQKLALSCMLIHEPDVIVLDEPTFGVDPVSRSEFWDILKALAKRGKSLLVTTAYMDEANLCDKVGLIFEGEILVNDKPGNLLGTYKNNVYLIKSRMPHVTYRKLTEHGLESQSNLFGEGVHFVDPEDKDISDIEKLLNESRIEYSEIKAVQPSLEDLFLKLQNDVDIKKNKTNN